jgi:hypothetical protein
VIRFVVLFGLGAALGTLIAFRMMIAVQEPLWFFSAVALGAIIGGALSYRFGERFWEQLRWLRWWL